MLNETSNKMVSPARKFNISMLLQLDLSIPLFLLNLIYLIPSLPFESLHDITFRQALIFSTLASWIVVISLRTKLGPYARPLKAFIGFIAYFIYILFQRGTSELLEPIRSQKYIIPLAQIFFLGILERTLILTFAGSRLCLTLNAAVIVLRYLLFRPDETLILIVFVLGDVLILFYTYIYEKRVKLDGMFGEQNIIEFKFLKDNLLQDLTTPLLFVERKNIESVFKNKKFELLLYNFNIEFKAFLDNLMLKVISSTEKYDSESQIGQHTLKKYLMNSKHLTLLNDAVVFLGSLKGQNHNNLLCEVIMSKGFYNGQDIICLQFVDLSTKKRLKMVEQSLTYKDDLLNTVAHDLRNPLGAIIGLLKTLDRIELDHTAQELILTCKNTSDMLLNIVNTYLDGSQIREKKLKLVPTGITLKEYLIEISKIFEFLCRQKNISFFTKFVTRTPRVITTDKHRLTQILFNLVSNAIKFTSKGYVCIVISAHSDLENSLQTITFSVQDTGIGISSANLTRLFQSFSKIESSAAINPYGVGLGLIISNDLVRILNPNHANTCIQVESKLDQGSAFYFSIPSRLSSSNDASSPPTPEYFEDFHLNVDEDAEQDSLESDTVNVVEGKMFDYSRDYGRLNGSKFYTPRNRNESPRSLSVLLGDYPWEGNLNLTVRRFNSRGLGAQHTRMGGLDPQTKAPTNKMIISAREELEKYNDIFRKSSLDTQMRTNSIDKVKNPVRLSRFKLDSITKKSLLLLDDNVFNIIAIKHILVEIGFEVIVAMNGREGIEAVKERYSNHGTLDGILMDCEMPEMNGFEATAILRDMMNREEIPIIPIIGLTGSEDHETIEKCKRVGMIEVLGKPLNEDKLLEILNNIRFKEKQLAFK